MIRISVCLAFCLFAAAAHAGDCAKLNPGDGFKELSAILECQEQRIKALEQSRGVAGVTASIAADGIWKRGKCLPYARDQAFKMTITIEETDGGVPLCWKDGVLIAKMASIRDGAILIFDAGGQAQNCPYSGHCSVKAAKETVTIYPEMLIAPGKKLARLTIESSPD